MMHHLRLLLAGTVLSLVCGTAVAQGPTVTPYGTSCGPVLSGEVVPNGGTQRFAFTVSNGTPRARVLLVVGIDETATPLPGTSCLLLTQLYFTQQHRLDATGRYTWSHALSSSFSGYARVQFLEVDLDAPGGVAYFPSNGVYMVVP
ncbi:MAG: hypothetical protein IPM29_05610 [Planctomycetes bacterium]|nr:hypothetical protein [Planctomycetota bacterium]